MLVLRGAPAFSSFRLNKWLTRLREIAAVRELHAEFRAARMHVLRDPRDRRDLRVGPQTQVAVTDAPFRRDRRRFGEDEAEAARRELPEMHDVPIVGDAIGRRVLAHRRDHGAIAQRDAAQRERGEELRARRMGGHDDRLPVIRTLG